MPAAIDLTGQTFERWTVLQQAEPQVSPKGYVTKRWRCRCECGIEKDVSAGTLIAGTSKSCGCLSAELTGERRRKTWQQKLWDRLEKDPVTGCWNWTGALNKWGYGVMSTGLAHRKAYKKAKADPAGNMVLHSCDNPRCCNPEHLFLGDNAANMADMKAKGRGRSRPGAHNHNAKLTQDQADEIRLAYDLGGETHTSLGLKYGLSDVAVGKIIRMEAYSPDTKLPSILAGEV